MCPQHQIMSKEGERRPLETSHLRTRNVTEDETQDLSLYRLMIPQCQIDKNAQGGQAAGALSKNLPVIQQCQVMSNEDNA